MATGNLRRMNEVRDPLELLLGRDPLSVRRRVEALERMLEGLFKVPLLGRRFGFDALLGLVPVAGDLLAGVIGLYLVWEGRNLGMSRWQVARMLANVGIDTMVGAVPIAGDLFDFLYRSNTRNLRIIRQHLDRHYPAARTLEG